MEKTFLVARREFSQRVRQRGFLLMSIGLPLIFIIIWLVTGTPGGPAADQTGSELEPLDKPIQAVGYVDQAGLIQKMPNAIPADMFRPLADIQAAEAALTRGDIGAYFIIPASYRETGDIQRVSQRLSVNAPDVRWFNRLLETNLLPEADVEQINRLRRPFYVASPKFMKVSPQDQAASQGNQLLPLVVTMAIIMPLFTSAGYLFQSMSQEKSSRIMEILLVSLQPRHLLSGKILGLGVLVLVQYIFWIVIGMLALLITGTEMEHLLAGISLSPGQLAWIVPFAVESFLLYATLMAGIGALARDVEDGRIWLFVISVPLMLPIYLWAVIARDPGGSVAVVLSLIPFSAPVAMLMRFTSTTIPIWQIVLSLGLLFLTVLGMTWLMAHLFRIHILLSGESISIRRMWIVLTNAS